MMKNTINLINVNRASLLELLAQELPNRVGAPLSVKNIKEGIPIFAVECKKGEKSINPAICDQDFNSSQKQDLKFPQPFNFFHLIQF